MSDLGTSNRRTFLRQAARTLSAGIGLALIPAIAKASPDSNTVCCPASCKSCTAPKVSYHCAGACDYCTCHNNVGCYSLVC